MAQNAKRAPASFWKQTIFWYYLVSLHQPDQQLAQVLRGLSAGQQLVPKGRHRAGQQPALAGAEQQDPVSLNYIATYFVCVVHSDGAVCRQRRSRRRIVFLSQTGAGKGYRYRIDRPGNDTAQTESLHDRILYRHR